LKIEFVCPNAEVRSDGNESCFIRVDKALYLAKRKRNDVVLLKDS